MKKLLLLSFALMLLSVVTVAQKINYYERAVSNMKYLVKDSSIYDQVVINKRGIYLFDKTSDVNNRFPEFAIYWDEVAYFLDMIYLMNEKATIEWYDNKKDKRIDVPEKYKWEWFNVMEQYPATYAGLKIMLDPGHFGGNFNSSVFENRYLRIKDFNPENPKEMFLYEAELNYACARLLQIKLRKLGVMVGLTRQQGMSAIGVSFNEWYVTQFMEDVYNYVSEGVFEKEYAEWLLTEATRKEIFEKVYKFKEFNKRIERVNAFHPDLTLVIHFNAEESNERSEEGFSNLVEQNYAMAFVPGSFMASELNNKNARVDFLRLLLSSDLDESIRFGKWWAKRHEIDLGVDMIPQNNNLQHVKNACVSTEIEGLYARNLAMTRKIKSTILVGESLYEDSEDEFYQLIKKDYVYEGVRTSKRVAEVADAYLNAIADWMIENQKLNKEILELANSN